MTPNQLSTSRLGLRTGDLVEVRSADEILATLDETHALDGMPFMPEMLRQCGRQFRVSKRAEKTCDTVSTGKGRRVRDAVHLENLRCDGSSHGGCQALCLMWWKEAWLKRAGVDDRAAVGTPASPTSATETSLKAAACSNDPQTGESVYSCQVTRLLDFTERQDWDEPWQYWRELRCGNYGLLEWTGTLARAALNAVRRRIGVPPSPNLQGKCADKTPTGEPLGIEAGDWVIVKTQAEIEETINAKKLNRGLSFDVEMLPFCGRRMRVLQKVDRILDEQTGKMRQLPNDCWILEGATCGGKLSRNRLFCTRAIYPYWREIWLRRAEEPELIAREYHAA